MESNTGFFRGSPEGCVFSSPKFSWGTDPHPGNILVSPGGQVGLIDFGQVYDPWRGWRTLGGVLYNCWLRCYKKLFTSKKGVKHISTKEAGKNHGGTRCSFLGGLGFTKGVFSKFRIIRPQSVGVDHGTSLVHGGLQSPYVPKLFVGSFAPHSK